jgi:hypothetical protein
VLGVVAAAAVAAVTASGAGALSLPIGSSGTTANSTTSSGTSHSTKSSSAGQPVATNELLCGMWTSGSEPVSGQSNIDHPSGAMATGNVYDFTGTPPSCDSESSLGTAFTWTIAHSNVNVGTERGTEHGEVVLPNGTREAGFDGHITNFDFATPISAAAPDTGCGTREIYYASGHIGTYDAAGSCSPSSVGNFNTHGGAQTGSHFRGNYGTVVYQDSRTNSPCQPGSTMYCFEAVLEGQTN